VQGGASADELVTRPVVFQCKRCRSILGDSLGLVAVNAELEVVVLGRTKGVTVGSELEVSRGGIEASSTFHAAFCASCGARVGRVFRTTPSTLDAMRDMFSLDRSALQSYQIGSGAPDDAALRSPASSATSTVASVEESASASSTDVRVAALEQAVGDLRTELGKAQRMILVLARFSRTAPPDPTLAGTGLGLSSTSATTSSPFATASALPRVAGTTPSLLRSPPLASPPPPHPASSSSSSGPRRALMSPSASSAAASARRTDKVAVLSDGDDDEDDDDDDEEEGGGDGGARSRKEKTHSSKRRRRG
jgi:Yippee zinc-binding/DNA-binding /Mis18, centromere assembly